MLIYVYSLPMIPLNDFIQQFFSRSHQRLFSLFMKSKGELLCSKGLLLVSLMSPKNTSTSEAVCNISQHTVRGDYPTAQPPSLRTTPCQYIPGCSPCPRTASSVRSVSLRHVVATREPLNVVPSLSQILTDFHKTQNGEYAAENYHILILLNSV
jgi:hypothetical protein